MNYTSLWISVRFENTDNLIWELILNAQLLIKMVTKRSDVLWDYIFVLIETASGQCSNPWQPHFYRTSFLGRDRFRDGHGQGQAVAGLCWGGRSCTVSLCSVQCTLNNSELCEARGTTVELVRFSDSTAPALRSSSSHWLHSSLHFIYSQYFLCVEFLRLGI